jgi:integrase/recombinase XerD
MNEELIRRFLAYLTAERGLAQNTLESYEYELKQFDQLLPNGLQQASRDELRKVFAELQNGGLSPRSQARKMSALRHFYDYLRRKRIVAENPLRNIPLPKLGHREPKPVNDADFDKLLSVPDTTTPTGLCEYALLRVFDSCGLRCSELVSLKPEDLHLDESHLIVCKGKGDKGRFVPIDEPGAQALTEYMERGWPVLYSGATRIFPLTRQRIWQILRALCIRAGVPPKHPHQLRHRFGSEVTKAGLELREVADLMGHESVDTTQQYVGLDLHYLREIFRKTHPRAVSR